MQKIYLRLVGRKNTVIRLLIVLTVMGIGGNGWGQIRTWDGSTSGAWFNPSNWLASTYPSGSSDVALFNNNVSLAVGYNMNFASISDKNIGSIIFGANATNPRSISNSSSTMAGALTLTVNPIITNKSSANHSITNGTGSDLAFGINLGNSTNSIINTDGSGNLTISCIISGAFPLTKSGIGTGVLNLSPGNTYTGKTTIATTFINATDESAFGANPGSFIGDQITLNGGGIQSTFGDVTFSSNRGINIGAGGGTFDVATNRTITASSTITGIGALNITGSGSALVLMMGQHTYTGTTTISGGTLQLNNVLGNTIPLTNNAVINGGTLNVNTNQTLNNLEINSGTLNIAAGITLTINGTLTYNGGTLNATGAVAYGSAGKLIYNASKISGIEWTNLNLPNAVTLNNASLVTLSNNASTSGNLTINNTSNLTGTGFILTVGGDWNSTSTNSGTGYSGGNNVLSTVVLNGSGTKSITHTGGVTFRNLNVTGTGYYTANNNITISVNTLNILNGTLDMLINTLDGSGNLTMTNGALKLAKLNTTLPELTGSYSITGGTIELNGAGSQELLGSTSYFNLTFGNSGTKTLSSAITNLNTITGTVIISGSVILNVANRTFGGKGTNLTMTGASRYITSGTSTKPDASGTYTLAPTSTIEFANNAGTQQDIRLAPTYANIDVSGSNVGLSGATSSLKMQATTSFKVTATGTFNVQNINGFAGTTTTAIDNTSAPIISLTVGSTINYDGINQALTNTVAYQNLKLSGTGLKTAPSTNLLIEGNLNRAATTTFNANLGRVVFQGTTSQTFTDATGLAPLEFYNLSNTNTSNVIVNNSFGVQNDLNLTPTAKLNLNTGDIILRSTAIRTAYISNLGTTTASTNITYGSGRFNIERYLPAVKSWRLLATPIQSFSSGDPTSPTINGSWREGISALSSTGYGTRITGPGAVGLTGVDEFTQRGSMKYYNSAINNYIEITGADMNSGYKIANDAGYYIFIRGDRGVALNVIPGITTLRLNGKLRTGSQTFNVNKNLAPSAGFQSIGNPYASRIDVRNIILLTGGVNESFYVWNPTAGFYGVGQFENYTKYGSNFTRNGSAAGAILNTIESGQAFFLQNNSTTTDGSVTIKESDKIIGSSLVSRVGATSPTLEINLLSNDIAGIEQLHDGVSINFDANYSNNIDNEDVRKINNTNDNISLKEGTQNLIVERRNILNQKDTIRLNLGSMRFAAYKLKIDPSVLSNLPLNAFLVDKFLQTTVPVSLTDTTNVNFSITNDAASSVADRFMIVFRSAKPIPQIIRNFLSIGVAKKSDNINIITWSYGNELNIAHYSIEQSYNGTTFISIGNKNAANLGNEQSYSFKDAFGKSVTNFYRVKATSINGEIQYTDVVKISDNELKPLFTVQPNPVENKTLHINFKNLKGDYTVNLVAKQGAIVYSVQISVSSPSETKDIVLRNLVAAGVYDLVIVDNFGKSVVQMVYIK